MTKLWQMMKKAHEIPRLAPPDDHGALADRDLVAVTGGTLLRGSNSDDRKGGRYLAMP